MSVDLVLRSAVLGWLRADTVLTGLIHAVHDGRPAALPARPALVVEETLSVDWSVKDRAGRETRLLFAVEGGRGQPARLAAIAAALDTRLTVMPAAVEDFHLVGFSFLRARLARGADGLPTLFVEYRARIMEQGKETGDGG